ncbi:MAG TPA: SAM-dependent methyltransferase, partial [Propionicimonas sp.]|uniref:SAM-dependent methyltransferase n=1 Tax=Propionicimonas sp. TaxID=1955623 RepID=UPI002F425642
MSGEVVFVGAGPGAADLITVRGARVIAEADIVIWASSLVDAAIVAGTRPGALVIDSAAESLEDITPLYQRAHDEDLLVARVHTGDPSIYGATAEQRRIC